MDVDESDDDEDQVLHVRSPTDLDRADARVQPSTIRPAVTTPVKSPAAPTPTPPSTPARRLPPHLRATAAAQHADGELPLASALQKLALRTGGAPASPPSQLGRTSVRWAEGPPTVIGKRVRVEEQGQEGAGPGPKRTRGRKDERWPGSSARGQTV